MKADAGKASAADGNAALVIAHPGHELLVYGWACRERPRVFVLTDGSGRSGTPRISRTSALLDSIGATRGFLFGTFGDATVYRALLDGDVGFFTSLSARLAKEFQELQVVRVVADSAEGFNVTHDIVRLIVDASCAMADCELGWSIENYEFAEFGPPNPQTALEESIRIELDDATYERKKRAVHDYEELSHEAQVLRTQHGERSFRIECLRRRQIGSPELDAIPVYERYGEALRARGEIKYVIRYHDHVQPVAEALAQSAGMRLQGRA